MQSHPAAEIIPSMCDAAFEDLVADIRDNGQREAIVVHEGMILDGRHRFRACQQLGLVPLTVEWDRNGGTPETFVASMNVHRRHLSTGQRSLIAAKLVTVKMGQRADLMTRKNEGQSLAGPAISTPQAAAIMNVGEASVNRAQTVLARGTAEEIAGIENGKLGLATVARGIQKGVAPATRKKKLALAETGKNVERIQRQQMHAELWARVSEALIALTSLPLASEVVEIVAAHPVRSRVVDDRLARSLQYLKDFDHAWRNRG